MAVVASVAVAGAMEVMVVWCGVVGVAVAVAAAV